MTAKHVRMRAALLATAMSVSLLALPLTTQTAATQIVYDPSNYAQNVIQAARALDQINNQVTSLQNQTQMLLNQARNLANLPQSSLQQLQRSIQNTQ
jgi:P-type conjugative transfer protein TrbJ